MFNCAVINAGPLIALSLIDRLHLLPGLFAECWVPQTVFDEVTVAGFGKPGATSLQNADWLERVRIIPTPDPLLVMELDAGEAEVITLARLLSPSIAIIDERRGRRIAQQVYGLPVKGTAGILVEAKRRGLIAEVRTSLLALRSAGYFLAGSVVDAACEAAGE